MGITPKEIIHEYLSASSERRMSDAAAYLADGAVLVFPQGQFNDLEGMATAMSGRYQRIAKAYDTWDVMEDASETVVVTTGTLSGVNTHGVKFADVRFCDRFVVRDGRIWEHHVWNDLAESGVLDKE
jgi:NADH dehydrogenase/NADH:ubiquinone oxidoreductase subunit G